MKGSLDLSPGRFGKFIDQRYEELTAFETCMPADKRGDLCGQVGHGQASSTSSAFGARRNERRNSHFRTYPLLKLLILLRSARLGGENISNFSKISRGYWR